MYSSRMAPTLASPASSSSILLFFSSSSSSSDPSSSLSALSLSFSLSEPDSSESSSSESSDPMSAAKPPELEEMPLAILVGVVGTGSGARPPGLRPPCWGRPTPLRPTAATWDQPSAVVWADCALIFLLLALISFFSRSFFSWAFSASLSTFFFSVKRFSESTSFFTSSISFGPSLALRGTHLLERRSLRSASMKRSRDESVESAESLSISSK
mmetsp:Transcript_27275/g.65023  ORF Transcript_27275/g.65023 Transcript_27275/m.65023 type:complete len:213 (-) Transcript_27275:1101-1739(-)